MFVYFFGLTIAISVLHKLHSKCNYSTTEKEVQLVLGEILDEVAKEPSSLNVSTSKKEERCC